MKIQRGQQRHRRHSCTRNPARDVSRSVMRALSAESARGIAPRASTEPDVDVSAYPARPTSEKLPAGSKGAFLEIPIDLILPELTCRRQRCILWCAGVRC